jgi:hypothetical protein
VYRAREYLVRLSEIETMHVVGTFRVVEQPDLVRGVYGGAQPLATSDVRSLARQGLIHSLSMWGENGKVRRIHTLTTSGLEFLNSVRPGGQRFHAGVVRPSELGHDALLYRAYIHEARRINAGGGTIKRVVLDYELKSRHFSKVNKAGETASYRKLQMESANELHLPIIDGHVVLPDFRIEYENDRGEPSRSDVEVATGNYRGQHVASKSAAGFRVYAERGAGRGLSVDKSAPLKGNVFREERGIVFPL